jgi:hypothetical protein
VIITMFGFLPRRSRRRAWWLRRRARSAKNGAFLVGRPPGKGQTAPGSSPHATPTSTGRPGTRVATGALPYGAPAPRMPEHKQIISRRAIIKRHSTGYCDNYGAFP